MANNFVAPASAIRLGRTQPFDLGSMHVEPALRRVLCGDASETLEPRVMQVLVALAQANGRVVSRDELIENCWSGVTVGDNAIHRTISCLRKIGQDFGVGAFRIETVARVGYRLDVSPSADRGSAADGARRPAHDPSELNIGLCVLPLKNSSGDDSQDFLADGVTEDIITELSKIAAVSVTPTRTSRALKGRSADLPSIQQALGVSHVIDGSVRRADGRVFASVQLIDVAADRIIWAERYDLAAHQLQSLPDRVARSVATTFGRAVGQAALAPHVQRAERSHEAFELVLMARHYHRTGHAGSLRGYNAVIEMCERATAVDPHYAEAWALMAAAQANRRRHFAVGDGGRAAVARAMRLDSNLAAARAINGQIAMMDGDYDRALVDVAKALDLDRDCLEAHLVAGQIHYRLRQLEMAIHSWERAVAIAETDFIPIGFLASCFAVHGDLVRARQAAQSLKVRTGLALSYEPDNSSAIGFAAYAHAVLGEVDDVEGLIAVAVMRGETNLQMKTSFVRALVLLGRHSAALDLLEEVLAAASAGFVVFAATDPSYDPLRGSPRFAALMAKAKGTG